MARLSSNLKNADRDMRRNQVTLSLIGVRRDLEIQGKDTEIHIFFSILNLNKSKIKRSSLSVYGMFSFYSENSVEIYMFRHVIVTEAR